MNSRGAVTMLVIIVVLVFIAGATYWLLRYKSPNQISSTTDITTNWKTYSSPKYGFAFKYPSNWTISEIDEGSYGDERRYLITFNKGERYDSGNIYDVEVYDLGGRAASDFVNNYFGQAGSGPDGIANIKINNYSVVRFYMGGVINPETGVSSDTNHYLFSKNSVGVDLSYRQFSNNKQDTNLLQIADTFKFN